MEHRSVDKELSSNRIPLEIRKWYEKWKDIVELTGPLGLKGITGLRDEGLSGTWVGHRSSRLNEQWRVIYKVVADLVLVHLIRVTPHDYRKK